jgi:hypothetical protein
MKTVTMCGRAKNCNHSQTMFKFKTWKQPRDYFLPAGNSMVLIEMDLSYLSEYLFEVA